MPHPSRNHISQTVVAEAFPWTDMDYEQPACSHSIPFLTYEGLVPATGEFQRDWVAFEGQGHGNYAQDARASEHMISNQDLTEEPKEMDDITGHSRWSDNFRDLRGAGGAGVHEVRDLPVFPAQSSLDFSAVPHRFYAVPHPMPTPLECKMAFGQPEDASFSPAQGSVDNSAVPQELRDLNSPSIPMPPDCDMTYDEHEGCTQQGDHLGQRSSAIPLSPSSHTNDSQQWLVPQQIYVGKKVFSTQTQAPLRFMDVNVAASQAIDAECLARALSDPLGLGFPDDTGAPDRKHQKLTVRYVFIDYDHQVLWHNPNPRQMNEYASTRRRSSDPFVKAALLLLGTGATSHEDSRSKPLLRITLVAIVARELQELMAKMETWNHPLTFRGVRVDFNHLGIVRIYRPTPATVQPVLEILPKYRHLYPNVAGAT